MIKGVVESEGRMMFYKPDINPILHKLSYEDLVPQDIRNRYIAESILIEKLRPLGEHYFIKVIFEDEKV